ncbi:helix-turn-helix transcriptional regulator [Microcoleus sp. F6_B6]
MESVEHINFCMLEAQHHHQKHRMDVQAREKFAEVICEMRAGRSYRAFARLLGVSHPTIKAWENLEGIPDRENLERVASLRGETLEEFKEFLGGSRTPSRLQNLLQQVRTIPDDELAVVLRVIADRIENS